MKPSVELYINLQLFAGEKTEKATPRRRQEARKKGQVVKSIELVTVVVFALTFLVLRIWLPNMALEFQKLFTHLSQVATDEVTVKTVNKLAREITLSLVKMVGPVMLTAMVAGLVANIMQVGFLFVSEPLKFDLNRINPINGFKRIFSKRALVELLKSVLKTCLVGYVTLSYLWQEMPRFSVLMDVSVAQSIGTIGEIAFNVCWRGIAVFIVIAVGDYFFQRYEYEKSLRMSKEEIKEEFKNLEGDPQIKARIREKQRQLVVRRMMQEVPKATVVITNPTHIAVALKYEDDMVAPQVIAKGQDHIAEKIKEIAREHRITIMENKPLARLLYQRVEVGEYIPADLYQAVAEVIAYVYRLKNRA